MREGDWNAENPIVGERSREGRGTVWREGGRKEGMVGERGR